MADAGLAAVRAEEPGEAPRPAGVSVLGLTEACAAAGEPPPDAWAGPESAAYVMYTSGSTGRPKGVVVTHRNVVRLVRDTDYMRFGADEVFLQLAAVSFDLATLEIWGPLVHGGTLVLPDAGVLSLDEVGRTIEQQGVTALWLTAGLFHRMVDEALPYLRGVRQLLAGGDVLSPAHVSRALAGLPGCRLIDGYGPTENTTFTCCHTVAEPPDGAVPVGRPIRNTWVQVVDRRLRAVPIGTPGELCAGGDGLARGYLGRPDLTAERFVPDPFAAEPGSRLYRTGDLVRWRPDGAVDFLGRLDRQVKIRGFRVEPDEVEQALGRHPGVAACAVAARRARAGDHQWVAYVAAAGEPAPGAAELRAFLERQLPAPLVPAHFVGLESLPLTANGKLDRAALPEPPAAEPAGGPAPRRPVEDILAGIWCEILGRERVSPRDDFFALGGHSLALMQVAARVRGALGVELPLRAFFAATTLAGLAARVERESAEAVPLPPLRRAGHGRPAPLSFAQRRLWLLDQLAPGEATYNMPFVVELRGPLDAAALAAALAGVAGRHESLRTTFPATGGEPAQVVAGDLPAPLVVDLTGLPPERRQAEADRRAAEEARRPFDLARGPLVRALLLRLSPAEAPAEHRLVLVLHHIVADGWSLDVLFRELGALYEAIGRGVAPALPDLPVQYSDYALWQREGLRGEALDRLLAYWRPRLRGMPPLEMPTDHPRTAAPGARGGERSRPVPPELLAALRALARREGATFYMVLLAAVQTLLHRYTGQADFGVGTPVANREVPEVEGLIGFFTNTLVLRAAAGDRLPWRALLAAAREAALGAYAHQAAPFELLVEELQPERDLARSPLFQAMLTVVEAPQTPRLPGLETAVLTLGTGTAKFELGFSVIAGTAGVEYRAGLFEAATIERLLDHWLSLLHGLAAAPETPLADLPLLTAEERRQLQAWNATAVEYPGEYFGEDPGEDCVHELIAAQAARTPGEVAVTCEG